MPILFLNIKSWKRDLNPRPTDYESVALPTALFQQLCAIRSTNMIIKVHALFDKRFLHLVFTLLL